MVQIIKTAAIAAGFFVASVGAAKASLMGDEVACDFTSNIFCSPATETVAGGAEFTIAQGGIGDLFEVDLDSNSIQLSYIFRTTARFGGISTLTLSDLDWVGATGEIVGIENFMTTASSGVSALDVMFIADAIMIDFAGTEWNTGQFLSFDLVTRHVPLPAALPLFIAGLAGLGFAGRRRKKTTA